MINTLEIDGFKAIINYDPEIEMFRGEFTGLNGGADFYATDPEGLKREGKISLDMFLKMCEEDGVEPRKDYSGKFNVRIPPQTHERLVSISAATGKSLNQMVTDAIEEKLENVA